MDGGLRSTGAGVHDDDRLLAELLAEKSPMAVPRDLWYQERMDIQLPKDCPGSARHVLESLQLGMLLHSRRHEACIEHLARLEDEVGRLATLAITGEDQSGVRDQELQRLIVSLVRRAEEAALTCEALQASQGHLCRRVERLRQPLAPGGVHRMRREVGVLRSVVLQRAEAIQQLGRSLSMVEPAFGEPAMQECGQLQVEASELRDADERCGLQVAAVQGQIDALWRLVSRRSQEPEVLMGDP
uniref:Uncharacterized protein n=1 Tax=Alexandrium monilatum TaxID=311494 RepID=A0A7S4VRK1_9DINO